MLFEHGFYFDNTLNESRFVMHDVTWEKVAALYYHFTEAFDRENVPSVYDAGVS